eukprot:scaffold2501_cov423-Prasinococcus_capsulatus_cf.AAC.6
MRNLTNVSVVVTCCRTSSDGVSRKPQWALLTSLIVVLFPTCDSNPCDGARLNRMTASCRSISAPNSCVVMRPALPTTAHVPYRTRCRISHSGRTSLKFLHAQVR